MQLTTRVSPRVPRAVRRLSWVTGEVPAGHLSFNASLFSFSRGELYTKAVLHVARESTVVPEPISGWRYIELNALDVPWIYH